MANCVIINIVTFFQIWWGSKQLHYTKKSPGLNTPASDHDSNIHDSNISTGEIFLFLLKYLLRTHRQNKNTQLNS